MKALADLIRYSLLLAIKAYTKVFYRFEVRWVGPPKKQFDQVKLVAMLHHTSLFEWLYAGSAPNSLLRRIAGHAMVPIAASTGSRLIVGNFLKSLAPHFVSITREPDHTWQAVLDRVHEDVMIIILPEGRMMRANGLDKHGRPMTMRGGIADILKTLSEGEMLFVYLGGLHHVQVPGQHLPRFFKTLEITFETVEIPAYIESLETPTDSARFKPKVKADMERRRDLYCPPRVVTAPDGQVEPTGN